MSTSSVKSIYGILAVVALIGCGKNKNISESDPIPPGAASRSSESVGAATNSDGLKNGMVYLGGQWRKATYEDKGEYAIVNKHIRVPAGQFFESSDENDAELGLLAQMDSGAVSQTHLWDNGVVPYEIAPSLVGDWAVGYLEEAMAVFNSQTPIQFEKYDQKKHQNLPTLKVVMDDNALQCFEAPWGKQPKNEDNKFRILGKNLRVPSPCLHSRVQGELLQALAKIVGMGPEYLRPDRDQHLIISNLKDPNDPSLKTLSGMAIGEFDFDSVTMIGPFLFNKAEDKSKPSITRKNGKSDFTGMNKLSEGDLRSIAFLYKEKGAPLIAADTTNGLPDVDWPDANSIADIPFTINESIKHCSNVKVTVHGVENYVGSLFDFKATVKKNGTLQKSCLLSFEKKEPMIKSCWDYKKNILVATNSDKCPDNTPSTTQSLEPGNYKVELTATKDKTKKISTEIFYINWKKPDIKTKKDFNLNVYFSYDHTRQPDWRNHPNLFTFSNGTAAMSVLGTVGVNNYPHRIRAQYTITGPDEKSFAVVDGRILNLEPLTKAEYKFSIRFEDTISGETRISKEFRLIPGTQICSAEKSAAIAGKINERVYQIRDNILNTQAARETAEKSVRENHPISKEIARLESEIPVIEAKLKSDEVKDKPAAVNGCESDPSVQGFPNSKLKEANATPASQCELVRSAIKGGSAWYDEFYKSAKAKKNANNKLIYPNNNAANKTIFENDMQIIKNSISSLLSAMQTHDQNQKNSQQEIDNVNASLATTRAELDTQLKTKKSDLIAANNKLGEVQVAVDANQQVIDARKAEATAREDNVWISFGDVTKGREKEKLFVEALLNENKCLMLGTVNARYSSNDPNKDRDAYWTNLYASITSFQ